MLLNSALAEIQHPDRMVRGTPSFGRRPGVEQPLAPDPQLIERHMAMPEHDQLSLRESTSHPPLPAFGGAAVVDHGDGDPADLDLQDGCESRLEPMIIVAEHRVERSEGGQLIEEGGTHNVPGVQDHVCRGQQIGGGGRETPR